MKAWSMLFFLFFFLPIQRFARVNPIAVILFRTTKRRIDDLFFPIPLLLLLKRYRCPR